MGKGHNVTYMGEKIPMIRVWFWPLEDVVTFFVGAVPLIVDYQGLLIKFTYDLYTEETTQTQSSLNCTGVKSPQSYHLSPSLFIV